MRVLVRAGKSPETVVGPEASFARNRSGVFGANVGNLLFTNAVFRAVNTVDADVVPDSLTTEQPTVTTEHIGRINAEFDQLVLPLANAFRPSFLPWLDRLTHVIENLDIPVVVVGVGAQLNVDGDHSETSPELDASTKRFVQAVLARSASIGVRGEITRDYLLSLGFADRDIDVIGCPSMYESPSLGVTRRTAELTSESPIAMNVTPSVRGIGRALIDNADRYGELDYIPQEHRELALLLWGQRLSGSFDEGIPSTIEHPLYRSGRIRFFLDPATWRSYMRTRDFAFGNRIHGTIAAISAGTPAMLLSHDSRTLELARYHAIPHVLMRDVAEIDARSLYESTDVEAPNLVQRENFDRYVAFLDRNAITHIHSPGNGNPAYDALLERAEYPDAVTPLGADGVDSVISRLRWLWQDVNADQKRPAGAYSPPFAPAARQIPDPLVQQRRALEALERRVAAMEGPVGYLTQPVEKRVLSGVRARLDRARNIRRSGR